MAKDNSIIIDNFQLGMADSPALGHSLIYNGDIDTKPGWLGAGKVSTSLTGVPTKAFLWMVNGPGGSRYGLTAEGKLYSISTSAVTLISGNTLTGGTGNGLVYWNDYLLVFRAYKIDAYGPISGTPSWTNLANVSPASSTTMWCPVVSQDGAVYVLVRKENSTVNYISKLEKTEDTEFSPGTAGSYSFTEKALDQLPGGYQATVMTEMGGELFIGAIYGSSGNFTPTLATGSKISAIFRWNKSDVSYEDPLKLNEYAPVQMAVVNGLLYFVTAGNPRVFVTNGLSYKLVKEIKSMDRSSSALTMGYPGAIIVQNGKLLFGVSENTSEATDKGYGVYSLDTETLVLTKDYELNSGTGATSYYSLLADTAGYFVANVWNTTTDEYSVLYKGGNNHGSCIYESKIYEVGDHYSPRTFTTMSLAFDRPLTEGDSVTVFFKPDEASNWVQIASWTSATATPSVATPFAKTCVSAKFRVVIYKSTGTPVFLKYVKIK